MKPTFYEFFAGGGMARAGLEPEWQCLFANDIDPKKAGSYIANWGRREFKLGDIFDLKASDLPDEADLAWASFPCQDLSLAGKGGGLDADRSGAFWGFYNIIHELKILNRLPRLLVLENVGGAVSSRGGEDFEAICRALASMGYTYGAIMIDAARFVPQSRPRLFIVAAKADREQLDALSSEEPIDWCTTSSLVRSYERLPKKLKSSWRWWRIKPPPARKAKLGEVIGDVPVGVRWHTAAQTKHLLGLMTPSHRRKVLGAKASEHRIVGTIYRRMRSNELGETIQRAEVRFDDIAGCLRTPVGGSSRQIVLIAGRNSLRTRLLSTNEAARLMGLPKGYKLPSAYNDAYHLIGDGVVVPVVRHLSKTLLTPLLHETILLQAA
jgi:DNA (cytosine-5)-methyltransferase 1